MESLIALARENAAAELHAQATSGSEEEACLRAQGFRHTRSEEFWRIDLATARHREPRIRLFLKKSPSWTIRPPQEKDLPAIRQLVDAYGLRRTNEIALKQKPQDFVNDDPALSTVIYEGETLRSVFLAKAGTGLDCPDVGVFSSDRFPASALSAYGAPNSLGRSTSAPGKLRKY